jgi:hypothetical protein
MRGAVAHAPPKETRGWHATVRVRHSPNSTRGGLHNTLAHIRRQISDMLILRRASWAAFSCHFIDGTSRSLCRDRHRGGKVTHHVGLSFYTLGCRLCVCCVQRQGEREPSLLHVKCCARARQRPGRADRDNMKYL